MNIGLLHVQPSDSTLTTLRVWRRSEQEIRIWIRFSLDTVINQINLSLKMQKIGPESYA